MISASALLILFLSSVSALTAPVAALDRRAILGRFASAATAVVALPALAITPPGTPHSTNVFPAHTRHIVHFSNLIVIVVCSNSTPGSRPTFAGEFNDPQHPGCKRNIKLAGSQVSVPRAAFLLVFLACPRTPPFLFSGSPKLPQFACFAPTIHKRLFIRPFWTSRRSSAVRTRTALPGR